MNKRDIYCFVQDMLDLKNHDTNKIFVLVINL